MATADITAHVKTTLEADATLMATATGGVHLVSDGSGPPLTPSLTSGAYETLSDNQKKLKPCLVISVESTPRVPWGQRIFLRLGAYQAMGYASTDAMLSRVRAVLDPDDQGEQLGPTSSSRYYITRHEGSLIRQSFDDSIQSADTIRDGVSYEADSYRIETEW